METIRNEENNFRDTFKYYKKKQPPPSLTTVLDPEVDKALFEEIQDKIEPLDNLELTNMNDRSQWKISYYKPNPGLVIIKDVFSSKDQLYWSKKCLKEYSSANYKRNIDHKDLNLFVENWWEESQQDPSLVDKLRWSTLGYHHDWDTKVYSENNKSVFPAELASLCFNIALVLGYPEYKAEAAIVNFYPFSATLSGHTDHSELNLSAPLISISFGQPAIFLLGGLTLKEKPAAFLINSGDVIIMKESARLSYHAVPKILSGPSKWSENVDGFCDKYLSSHRININVRQVN